MVIENTIVPSLPFLGTWANNDDLDQNAASDQGLHYLLTGIAIENKIKMLKYTRYLLNEKWTRPINKDGIVH